MEIIDGAVDDPVFPVCVVPLDSAEVLFVFMVRGAKDASEALVRASMISEDDLLHILSEVGVDLEGKTASDFRFYRPPCGEVHDDHVHPEDDRPN